MKKTGTPLLKTFFCGLKTVSYLNLGRQEMKCPFVKRHGDGSTGSATQDIGGQYGSKLHDLDNGSYDLLNPDNKDPVKL